MECQNTVIAGPSSVKIAEFGTAKEAACSLGLTNGGVTITAAVEKTDVVVDQSLLPVRKIATAAQYTVSIPLASITPKNLALAFGIEDKDGVIKIPAEKYFQVWVNTQGPVNENGVTAEREFYFAKVAFNGTGELALSRTEQQTVTLEGSLVDCSADGSSENAGFMTITDTYAEEEA